MGQDGVLYLVDGLYTIIDMAQNFQDTLLRYRMEAIIS